MRVLASLLLVGLVGCGGGSPSAPSGPSPDAKAPGTCTTACDCTPGHACHEGACKSGTEAVFCCEACPPQAPAAQACQRKDGTFASCGAH